MSTAHPSASPDDIGLASKQKAVDWLYDRVVNYWRVCENCFGERDIDDIHRTWGGSNEALRDLFCTCGSGSGQPHAADVAQPRLRGGEGTVSRQWADGSLPIRDASGLSEMKLVRNIAHHLEEHLDYPVYDDINPVLDVLAKRSKNYPTRTVLILKMGAWAVLTDEGKRQVREDAAGEDHR